MPIQEQPRGTGLWASSALASSLLAGSLLLAVPALGQGVPVGTAPNALAGTKAASAAHQQRLELHARQRWERHEAKVEHKVDRQRIKALKRKSHPAAAAKPRRLAHHRAHHTK